MRARISTVFSPGAPIDQVSLFAGRKKQIETVMDTITKTGQHVILYGERGVGKTSLANVLSAIMAHVEVDGFQTVRINCDSTDTYATIWHKVFREMTLSLEDPGFGFGGTSRTTKVPISSLLDPGLRPDDVRLALSRWCSNGIVIIDEIDRVEDAATTALLADTIKTLSDHVVGSTLVLVGVADSVDELISEHRSIERSVVQVQMPRMSLVELQEIIDKALAPIKMTIDNDARSWIVRLSLGLPHYTHLLGLYSATNAVNRGNMHIDVDDVAQAISEAASKTQQSIISQYVRATSSGRHTIYADVLLACALADTDDLGYFAAGDVRAPLSQIMKREYAISAFARHLNDFCEDRGPVLEKMGVKRRYRYRFINPMMQPYVMMRGYANGRWALDTLDKLQQK